MNSMISESRNDAEGEPVRFDSNVYDSEYEQTVEHNELQRKISNLQKQQQSPKKL
jgi:hypothetical protein